MHGEHRLGQLAARRRWRSAAARRPASRRRRRSRTGSASPRARPGWWAACAARPTRSAASVPGVHCTTQADAADLDDHRASSADRGDRPRTNAIIGAAPRRCGRAGGVDAAPGRRRARCGRWPAPARRRRRRARGASSSRSSRVTIAPTCALSARPLPVTAALTSLGVCSATGMPAAGGRDQGDAAGLGGAHDRADVVLAEDPLDRDGVGRVLVEPGVDAPLDRRPAAAPTRRSARGAHDVDVDQAQRPARPSPRPRRARTGSGPGRSRAPASASPPSPSEHLFGRQR